MKIVAFSDSHGYLPVLPSCDVVFIAGDISPMGSHHPNVQRKWLIDKFIPWVNGELCKKVYLVPGNHDFFLEKTSNNLELREFLEAMTNGKLKILINETVDVEFEDEWIRIHGTPYCSKFGTWAFMKSDEELKELYDKIPKGLDFLITHDAPMLNGQSNINSGPYAGRAAENKELAIAIMRTKPKYVLNGHIHSSFRNNSWENVQMRNVSIKNEHYGIENYLFEIEYVRTPDI